MIDLGSVTFKRLKNEFRGIAEHAMASFASAPPQFAGWASNWLAEKTKLAAPNKLPSHEACLEIENGFPMEELCPTHIAATMNLDSSDIWSFFCALSYCCTVFSERHHIDPQ